MVAVNGGQGLRCYTHPPHNPGPPSHPPPHTSTPPPAAVHHPGPAPAPAPAPHHPEPHLKSGPLITTQCGDLERLPCRVCNQLTGRCLGAGDRKAFVMEESVKRQTEVFKILLNICESKN